MFLLGLRVGRNQSTYRPIARQCRTISFRTRNLWPFRKTSLQLPGETPFFEEVRRPRILKSFLFVTAVAGLTSTVAAHLTNDETLKWVRFIHAKNPFRMDIPSNPELRLAREAALRIRIRDHFQHLRDFVNENKRVVYVTFYQAYVFVTVTWLQQGEANRAAIGLIALNTAIWLLWQIPRLRPLMRKHFTHDPLSGKSHTLLTAVFSHQSFLHLAANSLAIYNLCPAAYLTIARCPDVTDMVEAVPLFHFLSFFITAGLFSNFLAHIVRLRLIYPRLVSKVTQSEVAKLGSTSTLGTKAVAGASPASIILPSLGASGAIMAALTYTATVSPDRPASFILFPRGMEFPLSYAVYSMILLEVTGIMRGWRYFDHLGHLSGVLFGYLYGCFGSFYWERLRYSLLKLRNDVEVKRE